MTRGLLREAGKQSREPAAEHDAVLAREQVGVVEQARLERLHLGQAEALVRPVSSVGVEREPLVGFVRDGSDLDHAPNHRDCAAGLVARRAGSYPGEAAPCCRSRSTVPVPGSPPFPLSCWPRRPPSSSCCFPSAGSASSSQRSPCWPARALALLLARRARKREQARLEELETRRGEAPRPARRPAARDVADGAGRPWRDALRLALDRRADRLLRLGVGRAAATSTCASCTPTTATASSPSSSARARALRSVARLPPARARRPRRLGARGQRHGARPEGRAALRPDLPARRRRAEARRGPARAAPGRGARGRLRERRAPLAAGPAPPRRERDRRRRSTSTAR